MNESDKSLRYVVLQHDGISSPHCDLLFETTPGSELASARLDAWPPKSITRSANHRRLYLDYEGEISGNRGHVKRIANGACSAFVQSDGSIDVVCDTGLKLRIPSL
jgi:hypothetical protein